MPRGGARRDRLGGRVVSSTLGHRDAMLLVAQGHSYREVMTRLGYKTPSAVSHAIKRGIEVSEIRLGLARVLLDKVRAFDDRAERSSSSIFGHDRDDYDMFGNELHVLDLRLQDTLHDAGTVRGVRDVARLISWRCLGLPPGMDADRDRRLQLRMMEGTLDQIRDGYQDRSGVHRAIDTDLRRELLTAIARIHVNDMARLRNGLHAIEVSFRRKDPDWVEMLQELEKIIALLEELGVVWIGQTPATATTPPRTQKVF